MSAAGETNAGVRHRIEPVRWEPRRRRLTIAAVEPLTPRMRRIELASPDLHDFRTHAPDDHLKLFVPAPASSAAAPGDAVIGRHYTVRRFDAARGLLTIDFLLHDHGAASDWATRARVGDSVEIGGPKKSLVVQDDFDWYLLIGDETALPAIGRWLEELRPAVPVTTIVTIANDDERQTIETKADWHPIWLARDRRADDHGHGGGDGDGDDDRDGDGPALLAALDRLTLPAGDGYVWIAAEAQAARAVRAGMTERHRQPAAWVKSSGYWVRGVPGAHE